MIKISNLLKKSKDKVVAVNAKDGDNTSYLTDIKDVCVAFVNVVCIKIDPTRVIEWSPTKLISFGLKVADVIMQNKNNAERQNSEVCSLLKDEIYLQAAYIAKDVYNPKGGVLPGGWRKSRDFSDIAFCSEKINFISGLYEKVIGGTKQYIYATAGTNPASIKDWKNNIEQLYGKSEQYEMGAMISKELTSRIVGASSLTFVGHSLGGGLAINNSLHTGNKAIVFNPAALSADTLALCGKSSVEVGKDRVIAFLTPDDILNVLQDASQQSEGMSKVFPAVFGKRYYLKKESISPLKSHLIDNVIELMEQYG